MAEDRVAQAKALLLDGVSISHVATEMGYQSTQAFSKNFRLRMGMTPTEWLVREGLSKPASARVAEAEQLLVSGLYSVAGAAKSVGYSNCKALTAAFRRVHGVSPTEWLRNTDKQR